ncbi:ribosome maturation factor RimP [Thermotoga sp. KOL6]|uniref:ribosome maturation factor RimP n=1 Tax=Thermotoga sp. KOL6 TaxID=126741 RepID=UPI000C757FF5|nr:ribosome maturation factor RimP [Thermotoga sp. KOL6]PLV60153.1 ribosome assembly cofactor RimP [Thermotoga sp. KOL6]
MFEEMVVEKVRKEAERIAEEQGLEIFDIQYRRESRGWVLRIIIDNPVGYVSVRDCELFSRELEKFLDREDFIAHSYTLEVSSPGLDRPLRGPKDYVRFVGKLAKIVTKDGKTFIGRIESFSDGTITVSDEKGLHEIDIEDVKRANLEIEF